MSHRSRSARRLCVAGDKGTAWHRCRVWQLATAQPLHRPPVVSAGDRSIPPVSGCFARGTVDSAGERFFQPGNGCESRGRRACNGWGPVALSLTRQLRARQPCEPAPGSRKEARTPLSRSARIIRARRSSRRNPQSWGAKPPILGIKFFGFPLYHCSHNEQVEIIRPRKVSPGRAEPDVASIEKSKNPPGVLETWTIRGSHARAGFETRRGAWRSSGEQRCCSSRTQVRRETHDGR
jgi:hypothetical protein